MTHAQISHLYRERRGRGDATERPPACFKCGTPERLQDHRVCSGCHLEAGCPTCNPGLRVVSEMPDERRRSGRKKSYGVPLA